MDAKQVKTITISIIALLAVVITAFAMYHYLATGSPHALSNRYLPKISKNQEVKTSTIENFSIKQWGYSDTGREYSTVVADTKTNADVAYYRITKNSFEWQLRGNKKHALVVKSEGNGPLTVASFLLDGEELAILPQPVVFTDANLGAFQSSRFTPNEKFTGGTLRFDTQEYLIDFTGNTVKLKP